MTSPIVQQLYTNFMAALVLSGPPLVAAMIIGVLLAVIQAATQIQDQSLPQLVKVIVIAAVVIFFGVPMSVPLFENARSTFASFHNMTR